jgi:thymidylate synthase ThyX
VAAPTQSAQDAVLDGGARVRLRNWFDAPYDDAIAAARTCYSPRVIGADEVTPEQRGRIGALTYQGGHHTVFQHATFEFGLEGVSRQLVWSLLHSFPFYNSEQQSQRYVRLDEIRAHVPPTLQGEARAIYERSVADAWCAYRELTERLKPVVMGILTDLWRLKERQNKAFGRSVRREAEKKSIETARYVIPLACHTAMVYTVSGITLHRLQRMVAASDVVEEARDVVGKMVGAVRAFDPGFFDEIGEGELAEAELPENRVETRLVDPAWIEGFDKSLNGRRARLVDYGVNGPASVASAVRNVLGRPDLGDADALALVLDPARNKYRLDTLNVGVHSPLMRALNHAHYTFRKKLSHTADSQDQRHRMVPGSRPLLSRVVPTRVDVIEPGLIASDPGCSRVFREAVEAQWHARARLLALGVSPQLALYVLPNALAVRFEESGSLLHLLHKWTMRTCFNAQREIFDASMDEIAQVAAVHPELTRHVGPPCSVRSGLVSPRCTEGDHFCGVPVWKTFPDVTRRI